MGSSIYSRNNLLTFAFQILKRMTRFIKFIHLLMVTAFLIVVLQGCLKSTDPGLPIGVQKALNQSRLNKPELMKAILRFSEPQDSLPQQALFYLITNLPQQYTMYASMEDSAGNPVTFNSLDFSTESAIKQYIDSLSLMRGEVRYKMDSFGIDLDEVNEVFLTQNINEAIAAWKTTRWKSTNSFEDFLHWILPYRVANEPILNFRKHFRDKFADSISGAEDISTAVTKINALINSEIQCDDRFNRNPNLQNFMQLEQQKRGSSQEIALYKVYALRSLGIAAAMDYCPFFSDSVNGMFTATAFLPNGDKMVLTSDSKPNPYPGTKTPKVYQRTFDRIENSLFAIKQTKDHTPPFLGHYHYRDVSNYYLTTQDIEIQTTMINEKYLYLTVFNESKWKPIQWAIPDSTGVVVFKQMGVEQRYRLAMIQDDKVITIGEPFWHRKTN